MRIRKATTEDFDALKVITSKFISWEYKRDSKRIDPDYIKKGLRISLGKALKSKNSLILVAEEGKEVFGFCWGLIEKNSRLYKNRRRGYICALYVEPKYQGKGAGIGLIKDMLDWFRKRGIREFRIKAFKYNEKAHSIYLGLGFKDFIIDMIKED